MRVMLIMILACTALAWADAPYDGLQALGAGHVYQEQDSQMEMFALLTKYKERVVGIYIKHAPDEVHFYMNPTVWDRFKQVLIKARDHWDTLTPREFNLIGAQESYRVKNRKATLRLSLQGETALDKRRIQISLTGGADRVKHVSISLNHQQVKDFVDDLYKIDGYFAEAAKH